MPRKLKPFKIDEHEHKDSGIKFELYLDRNEKDFFADVCGEIVRAPSEEECRVLAFEKCETIAVYEWRKVIVVKTVTDRWNKCDRNKIELSFRVHTIAAKPGDPGRYVERRDVFRSLGSFSIQNYHGATVTKAEHGLFVLNYRPEIEASLRALEEGIAETGRRLDALFASDQIEDMLARGILESDLIRSLAPGK